MKWTIVGFNHPDQKKSLIYKQGILKKTLLKTIVEGIDKGCNLFSIRGFSEDWDELAGQKSIIDLVEAEEEI